jgi:hypothetical protein
VYGKALAGLCAITGIIIIAMPIGLLAANFSDTYRLSVEKKQIKRKLEKKFYKNKSQVGF